MRTIALVVLAAACSHGSAPPPQHTEPPPATTGSAAASGRPASVSDDLVAKADRAVAAITKLAGDLDAAADCKAASEALRTDKQMMQAVMADADQLEHLMNAADDAAKQWFAETYKPRLTAANTMAMKKATQCKDDPDFKAAFVEVNSPPAAQPPP